MSGRRRRAESLWDRKEETEMSEKIPWQGKELDSSFHGDGSRKRSNSVANDALMSSDFSGLPVRGNENMQTDNNRMNTGSAFDQWENPSDDTYSLPYRAGDRERSRSPNQSRGRSRRSPQSDERREYGGNDLMISRPHGLQNRKQVPCKFFTMGKCNRNNCKFSHDNNMTWNEGQSQTEGDDTVGNMASTLNGNGSSRHTTVEESSSLPELNLANALELLYALPISGNLDTKYENQQISNSKFGDAKQEPVENPGHEGGKSEAQAKVEECNDEKALRQFKIALVEFVKEILKPTWKEGKMSREVYKTIVKKVVDKVTSSIQAIQIPRTQEKIDQYLAFSKSKITKLVEAYVGRFLKA